MRAGRNEQGGGAPGMLLYLSFRELFETLEGDEVKVLLLAMFAYALDGTEPVFNSPTLRIAWAAVKDRLDSDRRNYEKVCLSNKYKRFLLECERYMPREQCPDYESWYALSDQGRLSAAKAAALTVADRGDQLQIQRQ